jgi:hypothetical protein
VRESLTKADEALQAITRPRKEETANAVSPLIGSAIDALPCAAPQGRLERRPPLRSAASAPQLPRRRRGVE